MLSSSVISGTLPRLLLLPLITPVLKPIIKFYYLWPSVIPILFLIYHTYEKVHLESVLLLVDFTLHDIFLFHTLGGRLHDLIILLQLNMIPLWLHTMITLLSYLFLDTLVVSWSWLLGIMWLWTWKNKCLFYNSDSRPLR